MSYDSFTFEAFGECQMENAFRRFDFTACILKYILQQNTQRFQRIFMSFLFKKKKKIAAIVEKTDIDAVR